MFSSCHFLLVRQRCHHSMRCCCVLGPESVGDLTAALLLAQLLFTCFSSLLLFFLQFLSVHVSSSHFLLTMQYYNQEKDDQLSDWCLAQPSPASLAVTAAVTDCLGHETLRDGRPPHLQEDSHAVLTHPPTYSSLLTLSSRFCFRIQQIHKHAVRVPNIYDKYG